KAERASAEAKLQKDAANEPPPYPTWEQIRAEEEELEPAIILIVEDDEGHVIRRVTGPVTAGFHRVAWDLRFPPPNPIELTEPEPDPFTTPPAGPFVVPGNYRVKLLKRVDGAETPLSQPQTFNVTPLYLETMNAADRSSTLAFQKRAARLQSAVLG